MAYQCEECGVTFPKLSQLLQHRRTQNHWRKYTCPSCKKAFTRKDNLERHLRKHADENSHHCPECLKVFSRENALDAHLHSKHGWESTGSTEIQAGSGQKRQAEAHGQTHVVKRLRKNDDPSNLYRISKIKQQKMEKFKTIASTYKVDFKNIEVTQIDDVLITLRIMFNAIFKDLTTGAKSADLVRLVVQSRSLDYPIVIPFLKVSDLTADRFMSELERVLQSNEDFTIDESLIFEVTIVDMPKGGVGKRCKYVNQGKFLKDKKCILRIQNNDDLCCARAIVTAKARLDQHPKWESIRKGYEPQQTLASALHETAKVTKTECGIEEIKKIQAVLDGYQLHIISKEHFNGIIYSGPEAEKKLYLYYHDNHYDVITSMAAFLTKNYFCTKCQKGYDHQEQHKCNNACHMCCKIHDNDLAEPWLYCSICNRYFKGERCFQLHQSQTTKGNSTCKTMYRCKVCDSTVNKKKRKKAHVCGEIFCDVCRDYFPREHQCYMLPESGIDEEIPKSVEEKFIEEGENPQTFIFFDFECRQDDVVQCEMGFKPDIHGKCEHCYSSKCGSFEHVPNLCIAHKVCTVCMDNDVTNTSECEHCGRNELIFKGSDTLDDFCQWLFSEDNYNVTVICHNFQGYDSYPILLYLYKNAIIPSIIPNGAKIMCLQVPSCKIKMIDSINFLPMALSKLPDMFGLTELAKGYFPHLINRKENRDMILSHLPDITYYNPDAMSPEAREAFLSWYYEHKNMSFNFQHELLIYCRSDVDILRRCCLKFRENFIDVTTIDPFEKSITIASACQRVFRTNFLKENSIGIIPTHGYNPQQNQSVKALQWIKYVSHCSGQRIKHARNGGERRIGDYTVDGYYEAEDGRKVVLEFHGDFWHGNPSKFSSTTWNPVSKLTMGELYQRTLDKKRFLEENGYTYQHIWESEFDQQLNENSQMAAFVHSLELVTPLEPRMAFYGGRTEAFILFKEASKDEIIKYYDVTSLYPFINKTGKTPLGHPEIITENFGDVTKYEGLIKCKVIPPRHLFVPVLPYKQNSKLLFALCRTCSETKQQAPCCHSDEERALIGTWVTDEVKKAKEKGYRIHTIYEVWHFSQVSQYDTVTKTGGLFTDYVNTFLKLKQEASGWPTWCQSEDQKQDYIQSYFEKEGIVLDYNNISKNKGMRALAKLMLNSFWGKFGQRGNMPQVEITDDPTVYFDKLTSESEEVTGINFVSTEAVELRWRFREDFVEPSGKTNVVIAAYTTAQARLKLYSYLEKLGPRALYADTDSIVFTTKTGEWEPALGDYLGDLTNETPNNSITTFVTGGPKNYAYHLHHPDEDEKLTHCKIRGFTLNYKNMLSINFSTMKAMVTSSEKNAVTVVDPFKICRDRDNAKLLTMSQTKDYRLVFDKRVIRDKYVSFPYGF